MKILHLGKFYSPIEGGIESINHIIVDSMQGNQQRIVSFNNRNNSVDEDVDNVPVIRASSSGVFASQPLSWKYFLELRRSIKLFNPDIIHFHYPNPLGAIYLLLSIKKHNKLIVHWHSDIVAQKFMKPFIRPIENRLLRRADSIIATSPNYIDASDNISQFKDKITIIPCSINEQTFFKAENDEAKIKDIKSRFQNKPIIFFVGRHVEYKGIEYLLKSERLVNSDCVFLIAGKGPLSDGLKARYNSERIHWLGRINDEEMRQYLYAADIFAFPSITRNEAFGVALAEAMYCYCPAVTFTINGSGVNWVSINEETGLEVNNCDSEAYAKAIDCLINDVNLRQKLGENAHKRVSRMFTKECVSQQYIDLYNNVYIKQR